LPDSAPAQTASIYEDTSLGWGNYNAAYLSFTMRDFHGFTARSNFTWSKAMGTTGYTQSTSSTTVLNPFNVGQMYGVQPFDVKFVYNLSMVYQPRWFLSSNKAIVRTMLGGWNFAPLFTAQSGIPLTANINNDCQSFGESNCSSDSTVENAVLTSPYRSGSSVHQNVTSASSVATSGNPAKGGSGLNIFADPTAVYNQFRRLILGVDTTSGGAGVLRGFPTWNLDMAISKEFKIPFKGREDIALQFNAQFSNIMNHFQPGMSTSNGSTSQSSSFLNIDTPSSFGVVTAQSNTPRQIEFGLRLHF
jgi:hypothetical protein